MIEGLKAEHKKPGKSFFQKDVVKLAKSLPGKIIVINRNKPLAARIVEVEAYGGPGDKSCHAYSGITKRNEIMFNEGGYLYVYFIYGMYYCANIVSAPEGEGTGVLIRAVEPLAGENEMMLNRFGQENISEKKRIMVSNGPGKLTQAMGITLEHNGVDLTGDLIYLVDDGFKVEELVTTERVGIRECADWPRRFYIKGNKFVSRI